MDKFEDVKSYILEDECITIYTLGLGYTTDQVLKIELFINIMSIKTLCLFSEKILIETEKFLNRWSLEDFEDIYETDFALSLTDEGIEKMNKELDILQFDILFEIQNEEDLQDLLLLLFKV